MKPFIRKNPGREQRENMAAAARLIRSPEFELTPAQRTELNKPKGGLILTSHQLNLYNQAGYRPIKSHHKKEV